MDREQGSKSNGEKTQGVKKTSFSFINTKSIIQHLEREGRGCYSRESS